MLAVRCFFRNVHTKLFLTAHHISLRGVHILSSKSYCTKHFDFMSNNRNVIYFQDYRLDSAHQLYNRAHFSKRSFSPSSPHSYKRRRMAESRGQEMCDNEQSKAGQAPGAYPGHSQRNHQPEASHSGNAQHGDAATHREPSRSSMQHNQERSSQFVRDPNRGNKGQYRAQGRGRGGPRQFYNPRMDNNQTCFHQAAESSGAQGCTKSDYCYYGNDQSYWSYVNQDDRNYGPWTSHNQRNSGLENDTWDKNKRNRKRDGSADDYHLSKFLSSILRHNAEKFNLKLMKGGFLYTDDILKLKQASGYTLKDIKRIVESNDKQRFTLSVDENGKDMIRANQGHTLEVNDLELTPITSPDEEEHVLHGTYHSSWNIIKTAGLNKMKRNHIHFSVGEPGDSGVISGMRSSCEVIIYLDMKKCLEAGLKFFRSTNNVILCSGNKEGVVYPCFFAEVVQRKPRQKLEFDRTISSAKKVSAEDNANEMSRKDKKKNKKKKKSKEEKDEVVEKDKEDSVEDVAALMDDKESSSFKNDSSDATDKKQPVSGDKEDLSKVGAAAISQSTNEGIDDWSDAEDSVPKTEDMQTNIDPSRNSNISGAMKEIQKDVQIVDTDNCDKLLVHIKLKQDPLVILYSGKELDKETGELKRMYVISCPDAYRFDFTSETEDRIMNACKENNLFDLKNRMKILHHCGNFSRYIFKKHSIILDGTPVFDSKIVFDEVDGVTREELRNDGFDPVKWKEADNFDKELDDDTALRHAQIMLDMFNKIESKRGEHKNYKKEIYMEVNRCIDKEEIKKLKKKTKELDKPAQQTEEIKGKPPTKKGGSGCGSGGKKRKGRGK